MKCDRISEFCAHKINSILSCPECGSTDLQKDELELICKNCGLVIEDSFIETPFVSDPEKERAKLPSQAIAGTQLNGKGAVRKEWLYEYSEKKQDELNERITYLARSLPLTKIAITDAQIFAQRLREKNLFNGRDPDEVLVACIYASCLVHNIILTHYDLELHTKIKGNTILNYYRTILAPLNLQFRRQEVPDLVRLYGNKLNVAPMKIHEITELWDKLKQNPLFKYRSALVVAGALIYHTCKGQVTQREIGFVAGIQINNLRKVVKLI